MKQKFVPSEDSKRTIFIGNNQEQINKLYSFLIQNNYQCSITTFTPASKLEERRFAEFEPKVPYYYIVVSAQQQYEAFEVGKAYAVENDLDDVICCYPNLDFDVVKNVKERELGLSK